MSYLKLYYSQERHDSRAKYLILVFYIVTSCHGEIQFLKFDIILVKEIRYYDYTLLANLQQTYLHSKIPP